MRDLSPIQVSGSNPAGAFQSFISNSNCKEDCIIIIITKQMQLIVIVVAAAGVGVVVAGGDSLIVVIGGGGVGVVGVHGVWLLNKVLLEKTFVTKVQLQKKKKFATNLHQL